MNKAGISIVVAASFAWIGVAVRSAEAAPVNTVVTSPTGVFTNPGPANAAGPGVGYDAWFANNVRSGASAGITTAYPDSGDGSIQFTAPTGAKADFEYYFSTGKTFLLSSLNALSYDLYRSSTSTAAAKYEPALRLYVSDGNKSGYLVYEGIYNGQAVAPVDGFASFDVLSAKFWGTGNLPDAFANYDRTLADWVTLLPNLKVTALSTGVGSGWDGTFAGAVDNVAFGTVQDGKTVFNFEVAGANAVPEPASIIAVTVGLLGLGAVRRRAG